MFVPIRTTHSIFLKESHNTVPIEITHSIFHMDSHNIVPIGTTYSYSHRNHIFTYIFNIPEGISYGVSPQETFDKIPLHRTFNNKSPGYDVIPS